MNDFDYDCYQKKVTGRSAARRKCGSKSRRCTLPSDRLTTAERKKMNGRVVCYNMHKPIKWNEFLEMPEDLQSEYIRSLVQSFDCTSKCIANMLGINPKAFSKYLSNSKINVKFQRGHKMSKSDQDAWAVFLGDNLENYAGEAAAGEPYDVIPEEQTCTAEPETDTTTSQKCEQPEKRCSMTEFSVQLSGEIHLSEVFDALQYLLNSGYTKGTVRISCTDLA